jgi:drug/metabolite transporter (DMT)-like permease
MALPLIAAFASAVCYGVASVLQAVAARRTAHGGPVDPRLLIRVLAQGPFLVGIGLDLLGFACQFYALRVLPLYLVQAALAANLAVTAVVAIPVLGLRLSALQWSAVGAVCVGLALLGISAGRESTATVRLSWRIGLLVIAIGLALIGVLAAKAPESVRGPMLGLTAGLGFAVLALSVRCLPDLRPMPLLTNPATYAAAVAGLVGFLCFAAGLQQAAVTTVTAAVVVTETAIPALIGVWLLGDGTRPGLAPVAVAGFLLAVAGAVGLASFGEVRDARPVLQS